MGYQYRIAVKFLKNLTAKSESGILLFKLALFINKQKYVEVL